MCGQSRMVAPLLALALAGLAPARLAGAADELAIAVPSSMRVAVDALNRAFEGLHTGCVVRVSTGASGSLCTQIRHGAPFDVFLSADLEHPRRLIESGDAEGDSLAIYAQGALVLWSTTPGVEVAGGLAVLTNGYVRRVAIANPELAPYGAAACAALTHADLWQRLQPKLVHGENIAQAAQFVQTGNAQAGLVARSLVATGDLAGKGTYWQVPHDWYPPLSHGAILLRRGRGNPMARAYLAFLRGPEARAILITCGLEAP
jgi:molybdate transport system substrate-binding protein